MLTEKAGIIKESMGGGVGGGGREGWGGRGRGGGGYGKRHMATG